MPASGYVGRFAPSPTGPLHAGSLVAALASWLDARSQGGRWLVRIEDVDSPRCLPGADREILRQLAACGLVPDGEVMHQSTRGAAYQAALDALVTRGQAYPCACSRKDIEQALAAAGHERTRHGELVYPGTCRHGLHGKPARAWRFLTEPLRTEPHTGVSEGSDLPTARSTQQAAADGHRIHWTDRRLGPQDQDVARDVGDFILRRADGLWAYQLAVVVDDAAQGVTDIVRGEDLADNTARQILLQRALGLPLPRYLHTPLVLGANGEKLSKQNGAAPLDLADPMACLQSAACTLGLEAPAVTAGNSHGSRQGDWLAAAVRAWAVRWPATIAAQAR